MKLFILLGFLIKLTNVVGQQSIFSNKIMLFRNSNPSSDTCICNRDKASHEYFFVDQNNYIHYVREGLGSEDIAFKLDTSNAGNKQLIKSEEYIRPHEVLNVFKFTKQQNRLFLNTKIDSNASVSELFFDFKTGKSNCSRSPFSSPLSDKVHKNILLKGDTVIRFNKRVFKCWNFEEYLSDHIVSFCIDRKSLVPLAYEIKGVRGEDVFVDGNLYYEKFGIWGVLELMTSSIKKVKIWKDYF
jgi:hypothetical protein